MFGNFFKKRKYRAIAFGELSIAWSDDRTATISIIFFENDNGKRKYIISGYNSSSFHNTRSYAPCETWKHTGLLPAWAKDPLAEKLIRD